jgi:hypothetical protein
VEDHQNRPLYGACYNEASATIPFSDPETVEVAPWDFSSNSYSSQDIRVPNWEPKSRTLIRVMRNTCPRSDLQSVSTTSGTVGGGQDLGPLPSGGWSWRSRDGVLRTDTGDRPENYRIIYERQDWFGHSMGRSHKAQLTPCLVLFEIIPCRVFRTTYEIEVSLSLNG